MSRKVARLVEEHSRSRLSSLHVLAFLADKSYGDDGVSWWSEMKIWTHLRISERALRDCITRLKALGELEVVQAHKETSTARFNVYRVTLPGVDEVDYERLASEGIVLSRPFRNTETAGGSSEPSPRTTGRNPQERPAENDTPSRAGDPCLDLETKEETKEVRGDESLRDPPDATVLGSETDREIRKLVESLADAKPGTYEKFRAEFGDLHPGEVRYAAERIGSRDGARSEVAVARKVLRDFLAFRVENHGPPHVDVRSS